MMMEQSQRSLVINMEILFDTNILLWALFDDERLPRRIKEKINDETNYIFVSMASLWEIEIKHNKNPKNMPYSMKQIFNVIVGGTDYKILDIRPEYLIELGNIINKGIHSDPFDHIILATAKSEKMNVLTSDSIFEQYINLGIKPIII